MIDHAAIRGILPHRHPILLVDTVLEWHPFDRIVTTKAVSGSEPCYAGMAEGLGRSAYSYPKTLLIESFGQSGAVLWLESIRTRGESLDGTLIFAAARNVEFHRPVQPGDTVRHELKIDQLVGANAFLSGRSFVGDEPVMTVGEAIAVIRPNGSPAQEA
ncbi:beta-hydroxyacyl-ACP dehydratase [Streptomyces sp. CB01881]|uniref:3-hydroxyacyl-ACP dehydratase FabZ family protein n=1 Tax=Streptomyces sp. CB01881 TaxID=2078691 RepID=UPI0013872640|nr:beta-hydroxyacyl-ACP dehydratase [Streptomyces sp. CB01881]